MKRALNIHPLFKVLAKVSLVARPNRTKWTCSMTGKTYTESKEHRKISESSRGVAKIVVFLGRLTLLEVINSIMFSILVEACLVMGFRSETVKVNSHNNCHK